MGIDAELRIARKNTVAFINADRYNVEFNRPLYMESEAGGIVSAGTDLILPQMARFVPLSGLVWDRSDTTPDEGRLPDVTEQLVMRWDADVKKEDWFPWDKDGLTGRLLVVHVSRFRHYRTSALLRFMEEGEDGNQGG